VKSHPYLKAYMAGITVPTIFLLVVLTFLVALRHLGHLSGPLEPFAVFPMAMVPNAWGAWNMLRVASAAARRLPLGWYGALLVAVLPPILYAVILALSSEPPALPPTALAVAWLVAIILYYLAWKYLVGFLNELLGVSA